MYFKFQDLIKVKGKTNFKHEKFESLTTVTIKFDPTSVR